MEPREMADGTEPRSGCELVVARGHNWTRPAPVEAYLDRVCAPLPPLRRAEVRAELAAHLDALVEAYRELGTPPDDAVAAALAQFGDARRLARQWRDAGDGPLPPAVLVSVGAVLGMSTLFGCVLMVGAGAAAGYSPVQELLGGPLFSLVAGFAVGRDRGQHPLGSWKGLLLVALANMGLALLFPTNPVVPPAATWLIHTLLGMMPACGAAGLGMLYARWKAYGFTRPGPRAA